VQQLTSTVSVPVRPKSKQELATEYDVHRNTIKDWCEKLGIMTRGRLTVLEILKFYQHYGLPGKYEMRLELA
jgi:hypothetical protein